MLNVGIIFASLLSLATYAAAQQPVWSQCGGIGWAGSTTCASGTLCTELNDYYFQCLPSPANPITPTPPVPPTTTAPIGSTSAQPTTVIPAHPHPSTTSPIGSSPTPSVAANFWFSFGDSYTQTGFVVNGTLPAVGNALGNPQYPGYTAVGGTNWIDVDTTVYNKSLVLTYNYAYGGATIDATLVQPYEPTVLSLTDQVNEFLSSAASKPATAPWTSTNALFSFWIGINDIGNSYYQSGSRDAFSDTLLNAYFALVQEIVSTAFHNTEINANAGGRNFLFINVPPVDRSPLMLAQAASAQALEKSVIQGFNAKLANRTASFQASNAGVTTWLYDSNAAFTQVLNDPQAYGFVDNTSFGGTGDFWGNNYHPSSAMHDILGKQIGQLLGSTVW